VGNGTTRTTGKIAPSHGASPHGQHDLYDLQGMHDLHNLQGQHDLHIGKTARR
jgi:hypothetical protein